MPAEFVPIRTSTLRGDQKISFDVFIQINEKRIHYLRQGDSFEGVRLQRLKAKKLKKMLIPSDQEELYRSYMQQNIEMAYDKSSGKSMEDRAQIVQGEQQSNTEAVLENPGDEQSYQIAKDGTARYVEFLMQEDKAVQAILNVENTDQDIAHHGVTVSTLAVSLANKLGINQPSRVQLLALGSLLHDMGHVQDAPVFYAPLADIPGDMQAAYKGHPMAGANVVRDKKHFDQTVIAIIAQHEECINGSGYPNGLLEKDMDQLAVIAACANAFDRMVVTLQQPRPDVLKKFTVEKMGLYPLNFIQTLRSVI